MKLPSGEELEFVRLFKKKYGYGPEHVSLRHSAWSIAVWNDDDIASIISKPQKVDTELQKIWAEHAATDRKTVVNPILSEYNAVGIPEPILYQHDIDNILTLHGMKNMGQLSTADSVLTNTHCYFGDNNTGELVGDTKLGNQLVAKSFDTDGERDTVDQQERYAMAVFRSDFAADVILKEAGIGTGTTPPTDLLTLHVTFADKPIGVGQTMTAQITVTHKNGTQ